MEHNPTHRLPVKRVRCKKYFVMCLLLALGIAFAVLPVLPTNLGTEEFSQGPLTYALTRITLAGFSIAFAVSFFRVTFRAAHFHRIQEVFWPTRCRHCAKAVGMCQQQRQSSDAKRHTRFSHQCRHVRMVYAAKHAGKSKASRGRL